MNKILPILILLFFSFGIGSNNASLFPSTNSSLEQSGFLPPIVFRNQSLVYNSNVFIDNLQIFGNLILNGSKIIFLPISEFNGHNDIIVESGANLTILSASFDYSLNLINPSFTITLKENSSLIINNTIIENIQNKNTGLPVIRGQPKTLIIDQSTIVNTEFPMNITLSEEKKNLNSIIIIQRNSFHNNYGQSLIEVKGYNFVEIINNTFSNELISITKGLSIEDVNTTIMSYNRFTPYYSQLNFKNNNIVKIFRNEINNLFPQNDRFLHFTNNNDVNVILNKFMGFKQPILFNNSIGKGFISLNDFYKENPDLMFQNDQDQITFVNNYYETISFLDLDSDGFSDTNYFLDESPLIFPFNSYEEKNGVLTLTNPYLIILSQNKPINPFGITILHFSDYITFF